MQEGMMRERELALQKVELQVQLRDRAIGLLCRGAKVRCGWFAGAREQGREGEMI